jgi:hypothetical protein
VVFEWLVLDFALDWVVLALCVLLDFFFSEPCVAFAGRTPASNPTLKTTVKAFVVLVKQHLKGYRNQPTSLGASKKGIGPTTRIRPTGTSAPA